MDSIQTSGLKGMVFSDFYEIKNKVDEDPLLKRLNSDISEIESDERSIDQTLSLPWKERVELVKSYEPDTYNNYGFKIFAKEKEKAFIMGFPISAAIVAAGLTATFAGVLPSFALGIVGFIGAVAGPGSSILLIKAAKKWLIPKKIDNQYVEKLKEKRCELEAHLKEARVSREEIKEKLIKSAIDDQMKKAIEEELNKKAIMEYDEFVEVGGIRIPINQRNS